MLNALHFVAFRCPMQWDRAARLFGQPDIVHRVWDFRAKAEIMPGDVAVFARGTADDPPSLYTYDDSAHN